VRCPSIRGSEFTPPCSDRKCHAFSVRVEVCCKLEAHEFWPGTVMSDKVDLYLLWESMLNMSLFDMIPKFVDARVCVV
jgi:hypothetical protein